MTFKEYLQESEEKTSRMSIRDIPASAERDVGREPIGRVYKMKDGYKIVTADKTRHYFNKNWKYINPSER